MDQLLTTAIWRRITAAVKRKPGRCVVAVAYFGKGASRLLPLRRGSTLVVDMSKKAVSAGQTKPSEVLKLIRFGVEVHSLENLHAKVFVIGDHAFVGSTNASHNSATEHLVEATLRTARRSVVVACRRFVASLRGELVTPEYAKNMERFYKPPKFPSPLDAAAKNRKGKVTFKHSPLWIVPTHRGGYDDRDRAEESRGMPSAKARLRSSRRFTVDTFSHSDTRLDKLKTDELIVEIIDEGNGQIMVTPAKRVLKVRRFVKGRTPHAIVFTEDAKHRRRKSLARVVKRLGRPGSELRRLHKQELTKRCRDRELVHRLLNLWPTSGDDQAG